MPTDNQANISEKFKELRIDRINTWKPRLEKNEYDFLFPIESEFLDRIETELTTEDLKVFTPLNYPYNLDKDYHIYISSVEANVVILIKSIYRESKRLYSKRKTLSFTLDPL